MSLYGLALSVVMVSKQIENETAGCSTTDMITGLLDAGLLDVHVSEDVRTHVTLSPFTGVYVNTGLFVPVFIPLTCH